MKNAAGILILLLFVLIASPTAWAESEVDACYRKGIFVMISCMADLAAEKGDASFCDEAKNEAVQYQCYAVTAEKLGDWKICLDIPSKSKDHVELRDVCLSDVAEKTADPALCDKIETANFRDSCNLKVWRKTGDSALCDKISDAGTKSMCTGEPVMVK